MTTPSRRPGSRAVLIGTATYTHPDLAAIPTALNNLTDLGEVLTSAGGAFAPEHCVALPDPVNGAQIGHAVAQAAGEATDVLLVYYTGHGVLDSRGRLHLTLTGTDPARPSWTSVPFQMLREEILESPATARILILDCCYSGRAFEAMSDTTSVITGVTSIQGTYTITSSAANETSFAPLGHRNTAFTGALLAAANTGDLTLDELYHRTEQHLIDHGHPRPRRRTIDTAGELKLLGTREHPIEQRGELAAETVYRKAAAAGRTDAMNHLGILLEQRGNLDDAEHWWRKAADADHTNAMNHLGYLLEQRGKLDDAEHWWRKAADTGHPDAMYHLGILLYQRDDLDNAETWWRKAADTGHSGATYNLGVLLKERGDTAKAEPQ
ncbi:tetratricopeptide repeat protein [Nocardia sp. NPDC057663]|uniref:caspase, EACC1-associated type n=1 Tax=Nocardia sp. NPDC057663 TaxID=3346201 RepID=UPI00366DD006